MQPQGSPLPSTPSLLLLCHLCLPGELMIRNCTEDSGGFLPTVCWPCAAGFACVDGVTASPCGARSWSPASSSACLPCSAACQKGLLTVRECASDSDRVCTLCPDGFGCEDGEIVERCAAGMFSSEGICIPCPLNHSSVDGSSTCTRVECKDDEIAVGFECRTCPPGYGCTPSGGIRLCGRNTYSKESTCVSCAANSHSAPGSVSISDCMCDPGYVKRQDSSSLCQACKAGTVWRDDGVCVPCQAGEYCLGKTHHETCPSDMYSHYGSSLCMECKPYSTCTPPRCMSETNCTCDDGFIELPGGECSRCEQGTAKINDNQCAPCAPGMECLGGAFVGVCPLSTYSPGNLSRCLQCIQCPELTRARCNSTHDSICDKTLVPLAIVTILQEYKTRIDGNTFGLFATVYAQSLPRAQLLRVCTAQDVCVTCFQGSCPESWPISGPVYHIAIEIRSDASRLKQNLEALIQTAFLMETARIAMAKVTETPFVGYSRVEHTVICPKSGIWNGAQCYTKQAPDEDDNKVLWLFGSMLCAMSALVCWLARRWPEQVDDAEV